MSNPLRSSKTHIYDVLSLRLIPTPVFSPHGLWREPWRIRMTWSRQGSTRTYSPRPPRFISATIPGQTPTERTLTLKSMHHKSFNYKEVLIRLWHMRRSHCGERMAKGLFNVSHNVLGLSGRLGPGTGDNISNNRTAAFCLERLVRAELDIDLIGCICHIANIVTLKYIAGEGKRSPIQFFVSISSYTRSRKRSQSRGYGRISLLGHILG